MALLFTNSTFTLVLMFSIVFPKSELFICFLKNTFQIFCLIVFLYVFQTQDILYIVLDFFNVSHNDTLEISYHVISPHYSLSSFPKQAGNHHEDPKALLDTLDQPLIYDHD